MNEMYKKACINKYASKPMDQSKVEEFLKAAKAASAAGNRKAMSLTAANLIFHQ